MKLHINQYSASHTEPAKAFNCIFAQWSMAKNLVHYVLQAISLNMAKGEGEK